MINIYANKSNALTSSDKGVLITAGATQLVLILSSGHSHAKLLESWFIAPDRIKHDNIFINLIFWNNEYQLNHIAASCLVRQQIMWALELNSIMLTHFSWKTITINLLTHRHDITRTWAIMNSCTFKFDVS